MPPDLRYPPHLGGNGKGIHQAWVLLLPDRKCYPVTRMLPVSQIMPVWLHSGPGPYRAFRRNVRGDPGGGQESLWPFWWTLVHPSAIKALGEDERGLIPVRLEARLIAGVVEWLSPLTEEEYSQLLVKELT